MKSRAVTSEESEYKEVRGLVRGLELLRVLNQTPGGGATTSALAKASGMHRTTVKRLLETLRNQGMLRLGSKGGFYLLSPNVLELSSAMQRVSWIQEVALPIMKEAAARLRWSCDIATYHEGNMVVWESTQRWTALSAHRTLVGESLPVTRTALGLAYLAGCGDAELEKVLDELARCDASRSVRSGHDAAVRNAIDATRMRGYAVKDRDATRLKHLGAIAVPVPGQLRPLAAINLVFENTSVTPSRIADYYGPEMQAVAQRIAQGYAYWRGGAVGAT